MASRSRPAIRAVLIDLSGTVHIGSNPTPRAVEALQCLRSCRPAVPFRFCSNTSKESTADVIKRLRKIGFEIHDDPSMQRMEVWTSVGAVAQMLRAKQLKRPFFILSESTRKECASLLPPTSHDAPYDSVVIGLSPALLDYDNLTTAFRILVGEHDLSSPKNAPNERAVPLIATHKAKYIQSSGGLSLGPGPFVEALENASGVKAEIVGKPTRAFFEAVIDDMGLDPSNQAAGKVVIIGDDIQADLGGGAVELGLWRVLVKTGKYRSGDESRPGVEPPDEIFDSFAGFVDSLLVDTSRARL
ncbi:hypothetical protein FIBSPDRAFT_949637 [Athelia psychrophila]|uniref:Haloacid dehalogenase-like hydrolase domain-containing protein 2 n=1 Tax=Athelia psychrophila TaxID=1759441 RepID=A0A166PJS3_9AGAM|nr:hypothetical protein FIBSPDRAFT_949637 [Fibularhizoctonia sp. CBS 109695]